MPTTAIQRSIDTRASVEIPEHVVFDRDIAGPGQRAAAWGIDLVLRVMVVAIALVPLSTIADVTGVDGLTTGALYVLMFALDWLWSTAFEALPGNATPGKRLMKLQVIRVDGAPPGVGDVVVRNLLRAADALPFAYGVGVASMAASDRMQRLGDRVAGTLVVRTRALPQRFERAAGSSATSASPALVAQVRRLPNGIRRAVQGWERAAARMGPRWAEAVAERGAAPLVTALGLDARMAARSLQQVADAVRVAEAETNEVAARRAPSWQLLQHAVEGAGSLAPSAESAVAMVRSYRDVCSDVGRFREAAVSAAVQAEVEGCCAVAHDQLYARPRVSRAPAVAALGTFLFSTFAKTIRKERALVLISALFLFAPMAATAVATANNPDLAARLLPAPQRQDLEDWYVRPEARSENDNAAMAGFYVQHNVGIALRAAAAGVFLGLGTLWVLVFNGVQLGATVGFLRSVGGLPNLLRYTSGHTAWELGAIVIAGAAGLRLGVALVVRDGLSVTGSLRRAAPTVGILAGGAAAMLLVAASIEGFWSARLWPDLPRVLFAALQLVVVALLWTGRLTRGAS